MMITDVTNLYQIRQAGLEVLNRELGPVSMIRFLQQYEKGYGDYSKERYEWLDNIYVKDIVKKIRKKRSDLLKES